MLAQNTLKDNTKANAKDILCRFHCAVSKASIMVVGKKEDDQSEAIVSSKHLAPPSLGGGATLRVFVAIDSGALAVRFSIGNIYKDK